LGTSFISVDPDGGIGGGPASLLALRQPRQPAGGFGSRASCCRDEIPWAVPGRGGPESVSWVVPGTVPLGTHATPGWANDFFRAGTARWKGRRFSAGELPKTENDLPPTSTGKGTASMGVGKPTRILSFSTGVEEFHEHRKLIAARSGAAFAFPTRRIRHSRAPDHFRAPGRWGPSGPRPQLGRRPAAGVAELRGTEGRTRRR